VNDWRGSEHELDLISAFSTESFGNLDEGRLKRAVAHYFDFTLGSSLGLKRHQRSDENYSKGTNRCFHDLPL
jgi:hypothetical protein